MRALIDDLGLARLTPFYRDWVFLGGAAAGLVFWLFLKVLVPAHHSPAAPARGKRKSVDGGEQGGQ